MKILSPPFRFLLAVGVAATATGGSRAAEAPVSSPPPSASVTGASPAAADRPSGYAPAADVDLYWGAIKIFRDGKTADWPRGREMLQQAADQEYTPAQNLLGLYYLRGGCGYEANPKKATNWFRLAAERRNAFAEAYLGFCLFDGIGVKKDHPQAGKWLSAATAPDADFVAPDPPPGLFARPDELTNNGGDTLSPEYPVSPADRVRALAHFVLGEIAAEKKDLPGAQEHYVTAAKMGDAARAGVYFAAVKAAVNYAFGKGIPRDMAKANEMLELSKKLSRRMWMVFVHNLVEEKKLDDFAEADVETESSAAMEQAQHQIQFQIAGSFADPKSKTYDAREAAKWYELAADEGEAWAMLSLGYLHSDGRLGQTDPAKAFGWFKKAAEQGHLPLGWANLAICYQNGLGTAKDPQEAAKIAAAHRDEDFICYLASIGQCPPSVVTYEQERQLVKTFATKNKDSQAQLLLGMRALDRAEGKVSLADAEKWFKRSAKAGNARAMLVLGAFYERFTYTLFQSFTEGLVKAVDWYRQAAEAGNADAMAGLGFCYANGRGVKADEAQAIVWYRKCLAAAPDHLLAHANLGLLLEIQYRRARETRPSDPAADLQQEMLHQYREAERLGSAEAALKLGQLAYDGKLMPQDFHEAYVHFDTAAGRGLVFAHRMLGQMHENGEGVPVTLRDAAYHYRLAALGGDTISLSRLCNFYLKGNGVSRDYDRAKLWLAMLMRLGNSTAVAAYGDALLNTGDYAGARALFEAILTDFSKGVVLQVPNSNVKVAITDKSRIEWLKGAAYLRLCRIYKNGLGVKADPAKAQSYFQKSLELGNESAVYTAAADALMAGKKAEALPLLQKAAAEDLPQAELELGRLYLAGEVVPRDNAKGLGLIRKAAKAALVDAEAELARLTLQRFPGAPDLDEAIRLAEAAESGGDATAKSIREQLEALREKPSTDTTTLSARPM